MQLYTHICAVVTSNLCSRKCRFRVLRNVVFSSRGQH